MAVDTEEAVTAVAAVTAAADNCRRATTMKKRPYRLDKTTASVYNERTQEYNPRNRKEIL